MCQERIRMSERGRVKKRKQARVDLAEQTDVGSYMR